MKRLLSREPSASGAPARRRPSRRATAILLSGLYTLAAAPAAHPQDQPPVSAGLLTLQGNERFRGRLDTLAGGILEWSHPDATRPFRFPLKHVTGLAFDGRPEPPLAPSRGGFRLAAPARGDDLRADLILTGLTPDQARAESSLVTGPIILPRTLLKTISFPHFNGATLLGGPARADEWVTPSGRPGDPWQVVDGTWVAGGRSTISRALNLPDRIRIDFDLAMPRPANFKIGFFAQINTNDAHQTTPGYYLECRAWGEVVLQRFNAVNKPVTLRASVKQTTPQAPTHYTILADRKERTVALMINGEPACAWLDDVGLEQDDRGLVLMGMAKMQAVSGLVVNAWHGNFDSVGPLPDERAADTVFFIDGTRAAGRVAGLSEGILTLSTPEGEQKHAFNRIERIDFRSVPAAAPDAAPAWHVTLIDGSVLPASPVQLENDELVLRLPGGGMCRTRLGHLRTLYNPATGDAPAGPDDGNADEE